MMRSILWAGCLLGLAFGCHTVPDPNDPDRQQRIDNCLKECDAGAAGRTNTAYPPAPSEQTDIRTACERRCHGLP